MAVGNAARALLVDDHPLVMDALANVLISGRIFASVVKLFSLEEALQFLAVDTDFALIIADLRMADTEGIESVTTLRESFPDLPVVVFQPESHFGQCGRCEQEVKHVTSGRVYVRRCATCLSPRRHQGKQVN